MANKIKMKISQEGMRKIVACFGYKGDMAKFRQYLASDPAKQHLMNRYYDKAKKLYAQAGGAVVGYNTGGMTKEEAQAKLKQIEYTVSGSGGDYSDLSTFDNYNFSNSPYTLEFKEVAKVLREQANHKEQVISILHTDLQAIQHTAGSTTPDTGTTTPQPTTPTVNPIEKDMGYG